MPDAVLFGKAQGEGPNVSDTSKKFLPEPSAAAVPENEQPAREPLRAPSDSMPTVVILLSNNRPIQLPEIAESDDGMS